MTVTPASFRIDFPEFANTTTYPDSEILIWLAIASQLQNPCKWGASDPAINNPPKGLYDLGLELFVAHNIALEADALKTAAAGGTPGGTPGVLSSKAVGPVSAGYDTSAGIEPGAGHWNLTIYGLRYIKLFRLAGAGVGQINGAYTGAPAAGTYGGAWPGPADYMTGETSD
jgi:hypothetical protein